MTKTIVISAVNITEGGTLTVLRDCVYFASKVLKDWRIIVMAHDYGLIPTAGIEVRIFPKVKKSWLRRIWLEWIGFKKISKEIRPDVWLSLHDMTPRVITARQVVYCHNPAIFYRISLLEAFLEPKFLLFNKFYAIVYKTFIKRNHFVVVQQQWIRNEFKRRFGDLPLIVAQPRTDFAPKQIVIKQNFPVVFLYPAFPRVFKNFEVLGEAAKVLLAMGVKNFEIRITISGTENRYARWLKIRYGDISAIRFIGKQDSEQMVHQYNSASAILFPSKLETWGLPITEAKSYGLPLIVADAPYALETVGEYKDVAFFPPNQHEILANIMHDFIEGKWMPSGNCGKYPEEPSAANWSQLLQMIVSHTDHKK